jgi:ribosomal protein S18 acetylase RimI-like enzyme
MQQEFARARPSGAPETPATSSLAVTVRHATESDIPGIASIQSHAGRSRREAGALLPAIHDPGRLVVVASVDGRLVGWGKTHYWDHDDGPALAGHYLGGVTVAPSWRRRGFGAVLTHARMQWMWQRASEAWYVVNAGNSTSVALHRRWGFVEVARRPAFHTTAFRGGAGLLMRASRPQA